MFYIFFIYRRGREST